MQGLHRSARCGEIGKEQIGKTVTIMGWVQKSRNKGSIVFTDVRDRSGILQVIFEQPAVCEADFKKAGELRSEFVIAVVGEVRLRLGAANTQIQTGEVEVLAKELRILSAAQTPPFPITEDCSVKEELRLKYRYLDLRRANLQRNLRMRSEIAQCIRTFLVKEEFLEMETPILTRSTPEGARDYLVPSRVQPGTFYALPQSPQLFKQLLMCAGYDRYFQIAKCFRDEDLRADRQPEFTQVDMELSFVDMEDVMAVNERLLQQLFQEILGVSISLPIPRMSFGEAMERFGSDKPDLRFDMELMDVSQLVNQSGFSVFEDAVASGGVVKGICVKGQAGLSRKKIDQLVTFVKGYGAKGLAYLAIKEDGTYASSFAKFCKPEVLQTVIDDMQAEENDILFFAADKKEIVCQVLGALRLELAKQLQLEPKQEYQFVWVTEFPLLEWSKEQQRYVAMHHPFTMPMEEDIALLDTDPGKVRAKAYDIILNGVELGGGSVRIHQNDIQEKVFSLLGFTKEEAKERFGFLLDAFAYGVPPHAGLAYGLDRLVMLMAKQESIRDVIAFPKQKDAICLMTEAPNQVEEAQIKELRLEITNKMRKE